MLVKNPKQSLIITTVFLFSLLIVNSTVLNPGEKTILAANAIENISSTYVIVDTGQTDWFDNTQKISSPQEFDAFYYQDAQHQGIQMAYRDNGDGTITDFNTGLMWQKSPGEKVSFADAVTNADTYGLAGYSDWRLPDIKELYSLINFNGVTGMNADDSTPYLNTTYFEFEYGDASIGERFIDSQYWSSGHG